MPGNDKKDKKLFKQPCAKAKVNRGAANPDFIIKEFNENFAEWVTARDEMDQEWKDSAKEQLDEINDGLGDALVDEDDASNFNLIEADMPKETKKTFCVTLLKEYFLIEGVDGVADDDE